MGGIFAYHRMSLFLLPALLIIDEIGYPMLFDNDDRLFAAGDRSQLTRLVDLDEYGP